MNNPGFFFLSLLRRGILRRRERRLRIIIPLKVQLIILWVYVCLAMLLAMMIGGVTPLSSPQAESDSDSKRARVRRPAPVKTEQNIARVRV